ncbi:Ankyrin repeat domain-containing protein 10 [Armadillidium nasatum]|uniref:Ankyrin repeat domain-containing protein 10 n=1 Tax=Armadillidium nasatum TaxID=96803 RepID=A0A5N5TNT0_9CRUS|nr:Ankyrin repeat domain-containing protein 10 [Armadillidium nasatum]
MARTLQAKEWNRTSEQELNQNFPLHRACRDGDIDALHCLLQQKDSAALHLSLEDTYYGWTPLHWACYFGKPECLQLLLKSSDGNVPDIKTSVYNQTPTHIAAFTGHSECLQILIEAKSDLDCQNQKL